MSRFNRPQTRAIGTTPMVTEPVASATTHEGGAGYLRDAKSELFLRATGSFANQGAFYEQPAVRDDRMRDLTRQLAVTQDGWEWLQAFLPWLRGPGNMRTGPVMMVAEATKARHDAGLPASSRLVTAVLQRPDEPGELVGYWQSRGYGRHVPVGMKTGIARALTKLVNPFSLLRYDTPSHAIRIGDLIDLYRPVPSGPVQSDLFRYAIDRRHGRGDEVPESLAMISKSKAAQSSDLADMSADDMKAAGMTWERALSQAGKDADRAKLWESLIPGMGYMALLRNLRNFDADKVSDTVAAQVAARLADPKQVARSRQMPYRFLAALREVQSFRWGAALDAALTLSLANVPALPGKTLILVDTSSSMNSLMSDGSKMKRWDSAVIFALALAAGTDATIWSYSTAARQFKPVKGESLLHAADRWVREGCNLGGGTATADAVARFHPGHDRVIVLTDEQARDNVSNALPATMPLHTVNVAGYTAGHAGGPNRFVYGGLTDAGLSMIGRVDAGAAGRWPWEDDE